MPKRVTKTPVCPRDLENLRESGLTRATIRANGLWSANAGDADRIARILNCGAGADACLGGLVFPYRNLDGEENGFARVRPHYPRHRKGKPIKYEQPRGEPLRAYFPVETVEPLRDGIDDIYITEGEKKALALSQLGLVAIGIGGVDCWGKNGNLIDDLAAIQWDGLNVYICFDYDEKASTRRNVDRATRRFALALKDAGATEICRVVLPPGRNNTKQGVDDFLVAAGKQAKARFKELVAEAKPALEAEPANTVIKIIPFTPPTLGEAAYLGRVGDFLRAVAPYTEATDAGVLGHLLPSLGMLAGSGPYVWAGNKQYARINTVLVGNTSTGRKGTSAAPVQLLMKRAFPDFWESQCVDGLSSGEGLIAKVADKKTKNQDGEWEVEPVEKRLQVVEEEFSRALAQMKREGNVLSQVIRSAFDSGSLHTLTVDPRDAVGAHISIVGHITPDELAERLDHIEMANGFGNRFLWFLVHSDKIMPQTQPIPDEVFDRFKDWVKTLQSAGDKAKDRHVSLSTVAVKRWEEVYPELRQDLPGLDGAMSARGSSIVLRLALIYALSQRPNAKNVRADELDAALAVWNYSRASVDKLFDSETGNKLCDKLFNLLRNGPMTRDEFNRHLSHKQKGVVRSALEKLQNWKMVKRTKVCRTQGAGRPAERWELV